MYVHSYWCGACAPYSYTVETFHEGEDVNWASTNLRTVKYHSTEMRDNLRGSTVLDTDNLHFSDEFLDFPVQADADIHADALGFSTRFRCNFLQNSVRKAGFHRGFVRKIANQQVRMYVAMYSASTYTRNTLPS